MLQSRLQLPFLSLSWVTILVIGLVALRFIMQAAHAQSIPQFRNYSAISPPVWLPGTIDFSEPENRKYRTRLTAASRQRANFAGHYVLSTWGCDGPQCMTGAIVNLPTGRVIFLPEVCCWGSVDGNFKPFEFRTDSRLVVISGQLNRQGDNATHFFELKNDALSLVGTISRGGIVESKATPSSPQTATGPSQENLYRAVANNETDKVSSFLLAGIDPNGRAVSDRVGTTPLHLAIRKHNSQVIDLLLNRGADVTALEEKNRSVLWVAVNINDTATVHKLLDRLNITSIINTPDAEFGYTPLHRAVDLSSAEIVNSLLKAGARTDIKSQDGETVRDICTQRPNVSCKEVLSNGR